MEPGKLFVGGISWDTNEDRLREYFQTFGEVVEAVIMKDRATGRARGFGFVIYADPAVAERVVRQKHMIDGRTVEAKKAVPRDDQQVFNRSHSSPVASPAPARTKKIFVGGLASTVTEGDFKRYFDQFGIITDVVVMYDHNTQRPRGFGFITFDSEDAVERALLRTFHELNGKMVEVKRAVPKELSPAPSRSPLGGGSGGLTRINSFLNGYAQGYNSSPIGGHGLKIDERPSPMSFARNGFASFSPSAYGAALNYEPRMSPSFGEAATLFPKMSFEQGLSALHNSNVIRHDGFADFDGVSNVNRHDGFVDFDGVSNVNRHDGFADFDGVSNGSTIGSSSWSLWGNVSSNDPGNNNSVTLRGRDIETSAFKNTEAIWNPSPISSIQAGGRPSVSNGLSLSYNREEATVGSYGRDLRTRMPLSSSFASLDGGYDAKFDNFGVGGNEQPWPLASLGLKGSGSLEFGLGNAVSDVPLNNPAGLCW